MGWTFYNSSGQQLKSGQTAISNLDIDGATDIGAAIVDADLFIIDDNASGTNRKTAASRLKTYIAGLTLIGTVVATDDATLTITGLDSTYDTYLITGADILGATDNTDLRFFLGDSSGVDEGASDYAFIIHRTDESGTHSVSAGTGAAFIGMNNASGNATGEGVGFVGWLTQPGDATVQPMVHGSLTAINNTGILEYSTWAGFRQAVITVDRVMIKFQSGNITSGRFTVWGLKHA